MIEPPTQVDQSGNSLPAIDVARIVDTGPFGYVTAGEKDIIDAINSTLCDWLGRDPNTIVGQQTFQDLLAPGDRIYYETHLRPMLSMQNEVNEIAVQMVRADGERLPVLMNSLLRTDENGDQRLEAVVIDATERRRYEQELLRERKSAESSEARLQVMYDVVSGLAGATTVEEIVAVVTERGERSMAGASCSVWLFSDELDSVARANEIGIGKGQYALPGGGPALVQLAHGDLLVIENVEKSIDEYPLLCQILSEAGHTSAAVAPLLADGLLIGVINYGFDEPHQFDAAARRSVASLAAQTEQALRRAHSIEAERRGRDRLESVFRFSARLSGALTIDEVLQVIAADSIELLGAASVRLAVVAEDRTSVRFIHSTGPQQTETTLDLEANSIACAVIRSKEGLVLGNRDEILQRYPDSPLLEDKSVASAIALPLVGERGVHGAWVLGYSESRPPEAEDEALLQLFAEQASQATSRAFFHQIEAVARTRADIRLAISESINAAITVEEVAEAITIQGRKAFDATHLAVYMADGTFPDGLDLVASVGFENGPPLHDIAVLRADFVMATVTKTLAPAHLEGSALERLRYGPFAAQAWEAVTLLPITASGNLIGLIVVGFENSNTVTPGIRAALAGVTAEAGAALGRARRYELEHEVAVTLQKSLLSTDLVNPDGWEISARYEPSSEHLFVGGDLFDVIHTDSGRAVVVVGDVVGHGLKAAAAMGQLRSAARALALVSPGPLEILQGLEVFAQITPGVMWATVACISIGPDGDGLYACAGHPYPVMIRNSGSSELLEDGRSPLLGLNEGSIPVASFHMDQDDCLVLYTDGLVELETESIDVGIQRLRDTLVQAHLNEGAIDAGDVVDTILDGSDSRDDIVVVCVTRTAQV